MNLLCSQLMLLCIMCIIVTDLLGLFLSLLVQVAACPIAEGQKVFDYTANERCKMYSAFEQVLI